MNRLANSAAPPFLVLYVDNVHDLVRDISPLPGSIPLVAPPVTDLWAEYRDMSSRVHRGFHLQVIDVKGMLRGSPLLVGFLAKAPPETRWVYSVRPSVQSFASMEAQQAQFYVVFYVAETGFLVGSSVVAINGATFPEVEAQAVMADIMPSFAPVALALVLARCDTTKLYRGQATGSAARAAKRRGEPFTPYVSLRIDDTVDLLRSEGKLDDAGLADALKACRAHFESGKSVISAQ